MHGDFSKDFKFVRGNAAPNTALVNATYYPASAAFIDVSGYEWVNVHINLGTIADAVSFTLKQAEAIAGTPDTIDTANCVKTIATTDDGQDINFFLETAQLAADHHFITCLTGAVSGNNYAQIQYFLGGARHQPVTQATALCPSDNQFSKAAA